MKIDKPVIAVYRIWSEYKPDPNDASKMREIEMVAYGPMGAQDRTVTHARIKDISRVVEDDGSQNPATAMARYRWDVIRPYYEAWKAGKTYTKEGTPLAAWNGVSAEQAELLHLRGVHTVEELADLTDTHVQRFGLPGLAGLIHLAGLYLKSADANRATGELDELKAKNAAAEEQIQELTAMVKELLAAQKASQASQAAEANSNRPHKKAA